MNPNNPNDPAAPNAPQFPQEGQQPTADPSMQPVAAPAPNPVEAPMVDVAQPAPQPAQPQQPMQPAQPMQPQAFGAAPDMNQPQPPMQPQGFGMGPAVAVPPQKSNNKLIILIVSIVAGLLLIGGGVWAILTFMVGGIKLETYKGDGYSVLVPSEYTKKESGGTISYESEKKKGKNDKDVYSTMSVSSTDMPTTMSKDQIVEMYDKLFSEDSFTQSVSAASPDGAGIKDFKSEKITHQGHTARKYTATAQQDGQKVGEFTMLVVFGDKKLYVLVLAAHSDIEPGFRKSVDKIINSFKVDE